jgi:hypothetical protein
MSTENMVAYKNEVMLLNWAESNTRGRTVTFLLPDEGDAHPFREFTVKTGKKAGQRFACVLVEIGDDELPVEKTPSQIAYLWCKDPAFWHWINETSFLTVEDEEGARAFVCETCRVKSRGDIDRQGHAKALWEAMIYNQYQQFRTAVETKQFA